MFHIQTEDSGIRRPHVITHLFADGGRILKTTKTSYDEHVGRPGMTEAVNGLMQEQHKAMIIALRNGEYDPLFDDAGAAPPAAAPRIAPPPPAAVVVTPPPVATPPAALPPAAPPAAVDLPPTVAPLTPAIPPPAISGAPPSSVLDLLRRGPVTAPYPGTSQPSSSLTGSGALSSLLAGTRPAASVTTGSPVRGPGAAASPVGGLGPAGSPVGGPGVANVEPGPASEKTPPSRRKGLRPALQISPETLHSRDLTPPAPLATSAVAPRAPQPGESGFELNVEDVEALERAAVVAQMPFFQQINDLPPPPTSVFGRKIGSPASTGTYTAVGEPAAPELRDAQAPAAPPRTPPPPPPVAPGAGASAGRYAPSRPASIFATNRPSEGASIFGEDLISEKSLDEVILSYLAEDLETPSGAGEKK